MAANAQKSILETILDWSVDRPLWQRDALRRIVASGSLDEANIKELVALCKAEKSGAKVEPAPLPLDASHLPAAPGQGEAVSLVSISEVVGVNNLAAAQVLEFEPDGVTIIYGDNGAGKSGYGRILKRACRARHAGKIEANVYAATRTSNTATATFNYRVGDKEQPPEVWTDGTVPHRILSAVSVFDRDCSAVHLKGKNEVAFRPFGLDIPDDLADACQRVKEVLTAEQKRAESERNPVFSNPTWKSHTAVGKALTSLSHTSKIEDLSVLGTLNAEEVVRLQQLREDLTKDPKKAASEQLLKADHINKVYQTLKLIAEKTSDESLTALWTASQDAEVKRRAAKIAADTAFSDEALEGVGGAVWGVLWEAARKYSTEIAYVGTPFPAIGDTNLCVLCQQPLDADTKVRLSSFEAFIQDDTEQLAHQAELLLKSLLDETRALPISLGPVKSNLQELALQSLVLEKKVKRFFASARVRRSEAFKSMKAGTPLTLSAPSENPLLELQQIEAKMRSYAADLQNSTTGEEWKKLLSELEELKGRETLSTLLSVVDQEIKRLRLIHFLGTCITDTNTNTITKLGNDIADKQITPKLRDRFQEEIVKLAAEKVRVEIVRSGGRYGSPQYQVRLFAKPEASVADILSEGEQTCVGLASFLTELATSSHRSALVFDDPVTSLDHRWRRQVAVRLVEEAKQRQIIVFTHDLVFVNDIFKLAEDAGRPVRCVTVARGPAGTGIVAPGLPWQGKSVENRIDRLEKATRDAQTLYNGNQEDEYKSATASIYNNLRATWERALEDVGFFRVVQRHRDYINTKDLKKVTALNDQDCDAFNAGFKKCCDMVDAHDPSSARNASPPTPTEIFADIQALKDWVVSLRDRQKLIG